MMQITLRDALSFEGVGLHTGARGFVRVLPAKPDAGITFVLGESRVPALAEYVVDTQRATVLGSGAESVSTTEHLLSALMGCGVTNAEIVVEGPEIPALDGSSAEYVAAIDRCGVVDQERPRRLFQVREPCRIVSGDRMIAAFPSDEFRVRFVADFAAPVGTQYFDATIDPTIYRAEIAGARTFAFLHEIEALWARGLGRGGSLENALVFAPDGPMQTLRWPNEAVRHKVLDLIGDLALLGAWPQCDIVAVKSGHELHASLTKTLRDRLHVTST